jgi:hypothetical protein
MNKRILRAKESEIAKAGRLVFDALFGETEVFERNLSEEIDRDAEAITVEGHGFDRCDGCGREKSLPAHNDQLVEEEGWRFDGACWHCPLCVRRPHTKEDTP